MKKIGLIAMSGIRAENKELKELGLTLPGVVERNKIIASLPSLGLLTLAALTPKEFSIEYIEVDDINVISEFNYNYDLVAISSFTAQINDAYILSQKYRNNGVVTVMGGLHVTSLPCEAINYCDSVVIGEGEVVWSILLKDFNENKLKKYYDSRKKEYNLAHSPIPRYDLLNANNYNRFTVQTSRGCPFQCEFCASSILLTKKYKQKPVENIINEIRAIKVIKEKPFIEFADDNSFVNKIFWKKLLTELQKEKIKWFTESDISVAQDRELLKLIRISGGQQILSGIESLSTK
jgi:radical SAM superfamily enzyme YgiQ (UPF0313 family)